MPLTTYLSDTDYTNPIEDKYVQEQLDDLNKITLDAHSTWRIQEIHYPKERFLFFQILPEITSYILYAHIKGCEWQVINMYGGTMVDKTTIINYMLGYLGGYDFYKRNGEK